MAQFNRALRIEWKGLEALQKELDPRGVRMALEDGLTDVANDVAHRAKDNVPRATGRLARTIRVFGRLSGPIRVIVAGSGTVRYAGAVHEGSGIHGSKGRRYPIRPKNKRVLFFPSQTVTTQRFGSKAKLKFRKSGRLSNRSRRRYGNAAYVTTRLVMHPGVRSRPFLRRALEETPAKDILARSLRKYWVSKGAR